MLGIYLSGTGNTEHCVRRLVAAIDKTAKCIPIEAENVIDEIRDNDLIVFGFPTQFSNAPLMVRDFVKNNSSLWENKEVICLATKGAFCGDVTGCVGRILKKYKARVIGGLQIKMPDSVCDSKLLKKSHEQNCKIVEMADEKIDMWASKILAGHYPHEGLTFIDHIRGLMGQRLWYYKKTAHYSTKLTVHDHCIGCGQCVRVCPMHNLKLNESSKAEPLGKCTMCYRCISLCPRKAITCIGKDVVEQTRIENFITNGGYPAPLGRG